jgi:class 3 adenylate cyclase
VELPHRDLKFTTTEDGVGIAFWEIGSGPPLIIIHNLSLNHAEVEWTVPSIASLYTELAARYRLVRFDFRGFGMSDNPFPARGTHLSGAQIGMSTDAMGHDIAAVAGACGIDKFTLMAVGSVGPVGIRYAAEHPDIVSELILCDAVARIDSSYLASMICISQAIAGIAAETGQEVPITMWERAVPEDELVAWTNLNRQAVAQQVDMSGAVEMAQLEWDSEEYLAQIRVPALLLSARNPHIDLLSDARKLTAGIPDSQLRIVNGKFTPYSADRTLVLEAIADILQPRDGRTSAPVSSFRTIVFTDVVGSTEFVRRVGDEEGRAAIRRVEVLVSELAEEEGGRVVKNLGDGSLVLFGSNSSAIRFALAIQDHVTGDGVLQLRVGLAAGEPIQEDGDIHGAVVAQASRIADIAHAGEVVVADSVRQLAVGKGFHFETAGDVLLKGFDEPTAVWRVLP